MPEAPSALVIEKPAVLDILDISKPALSSTNDMPVIETKPDATPKPEEVAAPEVEAEPTEESATPEPPESTSASAEPAKKPAKGVQKRLDELVRQREEEKRRGDEERRRADSEHAEKLRLLALLEKKAQPEEEVVVEEEPKIPARDQFADAAAYDAAIEQYVAEKSSRVAKREIASELERQEKKRADADIATQQEAVRQAYVARVDKAKEAHPDYIEVAESPDVQVSIPMAHAIAHSEHGPEVAYYLGKNPEEAKRISALVAPLQLVELGKIEAKLTAPTPPAVAPAPKPPVSAAPPPGKPIQAAAETPPISPENETMEQYATRRKKELAAEHSRSGARR